MVPRTQELYRRLAQRGEKLSVATRELVRLLDLYGAAELDRAVAEALAKDSPHPQTVRLVLERNRMQLCLPLNLPDDPRLREIVVRPHDLNSYDSLLEDNDQDSDDDPTHR